MPPIEPFEKRFIRQLRDAGLPVSVFEVDQYYELNHEPDVTVQVRSWGLFRETYRPENLTAPLFRWAFDDGRKFQGRPPVHVHYRTWGNLIAGGETAEYDQDKMVRELHEMIERSFRDGADEET